MAKLIKMNVLIVGLRGLGVETAKNLILAGPKSVTLFDPTPVSWGDLSSNFYCREEHVGKTSRAIASYEKLTDLNPYVKVNVVSSLTLEDHANFHVVAYTEILTNIDEMIEINEFVRSKNIGFILSQTYGPQGFTFLDYGNDFIINDVNGSEISLFGIKTITRTNPCIVTSNLNINNKFQDGDHVKFSDV
jgi:ubiquitin-activating enzyme E1